MPRSIWPIPERMLLAVQLLGTAAVVACVPSNAVKTLVLPCWWFLTFRRFRLRELAVYLLVCGLFTVMDILAVAHGTFVFDHPDFAGLPSYELLLWGYYILHAIRFLKPRAPAFSWGALLLAIPFAASFSCIEQPLTLLLVTAGVLGLGLVFNHERSTCACMVYMILIGAVFEYGGVWSGQWHYPHPPLGGVPPWFATLWGGVGFFTATLVLPLLTARSEPSRELFVAPDRRPC